MRNNIRFHDKSKIKHVPIHAELWTILLDWKQERKLNHPEDYVVPLIGDTLTTYFKRAMRKCGIDKKGSVHIIRHTAATKLAEAGFTEHDLMEWFGWSDPRMVRRYVHIANDRLQKLAKLAKL